MQSTKWGGIVLGLILMMGVVGTAGASERGPGKAMGSGNSDAEIEVAFTDGCTGYVVDSTKDISFISTNTVGGAYDKDEFGGDTPTVTDGGDEALKSIVVKSGTTTVVANCEGDGPVVIDPDELPECDNGLDDDGDGSIDHPDDPQCETPDDDDEGDGDGGGGEPDTEGPPGDPTCSDGIDNDGDGDIDMDDSDCDDGEPDTEGPPGDETCSDGIDNDGDGAVDGDDTDCQEEPDTEGPPGDPTCSDGMDNDGDGLVDGDDPDCQGGGGDADPCTGDAGDAGLLTDDTLGQTLFDGGLDVDPLTEDPDADGVISGPLHGLGADTPLEVVTDEVACAADLLISGEASPLDP